MRRWRRRPRRAPWARPAPRRRHRPTHAQAESRRLLPRGHNRALLARRPGGGCGVAGEWCLGEEDGENRPKMGMEVLSKDRVGAMCRSLDAEVGKLASRDLGGIEVPTLLLDAAYVKCGREGRAQPMAVVTAIGVVFDGVRRMFGDVRHISFESTLRLAEPSEPELLESEASCRKGLIIV